MTSLSTPSALRNVHGQISSQFLLPQFSYRAGPSALLIFFYIGSLLVRIDSTKFSCKLLEISTEKLGNVWMLTSNAQATM